MLHYVDIKNGYIIVIKMIKLDNLQVKLQYHNMYHVKSLWILWFYYIFSTFAILCMMRPKKHICRVRKFRQLPAGNTAQPGQYHGSQLLSRWDTWRMGSQDGRKWLITPIYKPFRPFVRGITLLRALGIRALGIRALGIPPKNAIKTTVSKSSKDRVVGPFPNGRTSWLINGVD